MTRLRCFKCGSGETRRDSYSRRRGARNCRRCGHVWEVDETFNAAREAAGKVERMAGDLPGLLDLARRLGLDVPVELARAGGQLRTLGRALQQRASDASGGAA